MDLIYSSRPYEIILQENPDSEMIDLLKSTQWGTDGPIYQHIDTEQRIFKMDRPLFFSLKKNGKTIGTCNFTRRKVNVKGKTYEVRYSRYFAIEKENQCKIFGHLILKNIKAHFEQNTLEPTVFYAYVDPENLRSHKLLQHIGFSDVRKFETFVFSRVFPKADSRVARIKAEEREELLALLNEQYENYTLVNFDKLFLQDNYFILRRDNKIVAGIHANRTAWAIQHLPGFSGKIIINLIPHIPILSRLFNPKNFNFAAFDGIYCRTGYEKDLFVLMESVCSLLNLNTGMTWFDFDSELNSRLKKGGDWGFMNNLKKNIPGYLVATFKNVGKQEQKIFYNCPAYINSLDLI